MEKKPIDIIKEKRTVPEALRSLRKEYNQIRKQIKETLKTGAKTIPEIAQSTGITAAEVTYHLMTMRKFGEVEAGEPDDMDEYYYYQLKSDK